jgi:hypothetical protein
MLEELQSLSETNKKRVLVIATIIIMIIIIGVWVTYFNNIIIGNSSQAASQATSTAVAAPAPVAPPAGPGVWQNIENGLRRFVNIFRKPSQYNIQPQQ